MFCSELNMMENWDEFVTKKDRAIPHYGFPFCHGDDVPDDNYSDPNYQCGTGNNINYVRPYQNLVPHSAPLGLTMYRHPRLNNGKLVALFAEHGGWNTPLPTAGFRVMMVDAESPNRYSDAAKYQEFATGFVYPNSSDWVNIKGRPVDVLVMKDNSVLVSDDWTGAVYRIYDTAPSVPPPPPSPIPPVQSSSAVKNPPKVEQSLIRPVKSTPKKPGPQASNRPIPTVSKRANFATSLSFLVSLLILFMTL